jgi:calcium-dependent protein kinase
MVEKEIVDKIANCTYNFRGRRWSYVSEQAKTFVANLIVLNPDERPTAEEAKQSMWLNARHTSSVSSVRTEDDMSVVRNSLEQFSQLKKLQKLALMVIAHKSSSEEIGFLRRAFKRYDTDKNGTIELPEFKKCLSKYDYSDEYLQHLFEQVDMDGTGEIKYTEFIAATVQSAGLITEDRLAEAFDRLDSDDSGFITIQNLRDLLGDEVPSEYLEGIMQEADVHKDKRISYADFLELWEEDVEDTSLSALRGISKQRTIKNVIDDLTTSSSDEHLTCSDSDPDLAGDKHSAF